MQPGRLPKFRCGFRVVPCVHVHLARAAVRVVIDSQYISDGRYWLTHQLQSCIRFATSEPAVQFLPMRIVKGLVQTRQRVMLARILHRPHQVCLHHKFGGHDQQVQGWHDFHNRPRRPSTGHHRSIRCKVAFRETRHQFWAAMLIHYGAILDRPLLAWQDFPRISQAHSRILHSSALSGAVRHVDHRSHTLHPRLVVIARQLLARHSASLTKVVRDLGSDFPATFRTGVRLFYLHRPAECGQVVAIDPNGFRQEFLSTTLMTLSFHKSPRYPGGFAAHGERQRTSHASDEPAWFALISSQSPGRAQNRGAVLRFPGDFRLRGATTPPGSRGNLSNQGSLGRSAIPITRD